MISLQKLKKHLYYNFTKYRLTLINSRYKEEKHHYLFILSPPFCGSTLLNELISSSDNVSCNNNIGTREGQTLPELRKIMFENNRWNENIILPWKEIKDIWHTYWDFSKTILLEKSIPNIMRVKEIKRIFQPISFICIVRNPYAQCEGIIRRNKKSARSAAEFTIKCLRYQRKNIENENNLLFFTYEELCNDTDQIVNNIISFIPEIENINSKKQFSAHNFKTKKKMGITNLNSEKISNLTKVQLHEINKCFRKEEELLKYFKYEIIR